jgi:ligand-binding sensor protein/putative methionine-R-sulfoxide reductase with GAF domain
MPTQRKDNLNDRPFSLKDLVDIKEWQRIQDCFSSLMGVGLRTLDSKGVLFTSPSGEPRLCSELKKDSTIRKKVCVCLPTFLGGKGVVDKNLSFTCGAGLQNFIVPLRNNGWSFGYCIVGPVILVMRKPKEEYRKITEELNLDLEEFWSALLEIKVISFQSVQSLLELIKDVGEYTIKQAYKCLTHGKEMIMAIDSPKLSRLLNALLDVAFEVTGADVGSIMLKDEDKGELRIHTSKGLSNEVIKNARVKVGEGISGIVAKEGASFVIDDNIKDNRIKQHLNRPSISSSMVIPIKVEDRVWGVINLGALKTSAVRFDVSNVRLIDRLINLATVALHE